MTELFDDDLKPILVAALLGKGVPLEMIQHGTKLGLVQTTGDQWNPGGAWKPAVLEAMTVPMLLKLWGQLWGGDDWVGEA